MHDILMARHAHRTGVIPAIIAAVLCMHGASLLAREHPEPLPLPGGSDCTVIVCDSLDSYHSLAVEIAAREGLRLERRFADAIAHDPLFVVWVCEPRSLSERALAEAGISMRDRGLPVCLGLITGGSIGAARRLYERQPADARHRAYIDGRDGAITLIEADRESALPLDSLGLEKALHRTGYLCFFGHGGADYWRLGGESLLRSADIDTVPPLVVTTGACQTVRPWHEGSIARAFTDRGAAAYAGYLFSPAPYYHLGFPHGFPLRFTHARFPFGLVLALQNRAAMSSYARFPFYVLIGDPRRFFEGGEPFRPIDDVGRDDGRLLRFEAAPRGFIPVLIEGGAEYDFLEVEGAGSAGKGDIFYNGKLQFLDVGRDRYLLFDHGGGDFEIRLSHSAPLLWTARDALVDCLDHTFVYLPSTGSATFFLIVTASVLFVTVIHAVRSGGVAHAFYPALATGVCVALWRGLYALVRGEGVSVVSAPVGVEPRFIAASLILAGCGALLLFTVRSRIWRTGAFLVITFPAWVVSLVWAAGITFVNRAGAPPGIGEEIYSYDLAVMPAIGFAVEALALLLLVHLLSRRVPVKR